ncbi:MAG: hypothetical protein Q7K42_02295, partial [Candidatus Diapherotrites archaeon]|nr:hypothetical protein [Candidatus Diapherotrites archaeon]
MKTRTVIRVTALRGKNMDREKEWAPLILRGNPMFVEIKGYSWIGPSRVKMEEDKMPSFEEVREFSKNLAKESGYIYKDDFEHARVCLLSRPDIKDSEMKIDFDGFFEKVEKDKAAKAN